MSLTYSSTQTKSKPTEACQQITMVSKNAHFHFPWVTLEHRAPVTLCYFKQHAGNVWHYNQPITPQTCWSWRLPVCQAPQTSHSYRLEYMERGSGGSNVSGQAPSPQNPAHHHDKAWWDLSSATCTMCHGTWPMGHRGHVALGQQPRWEMAYIRDGSFVTSDHPPLPHSYRHLLAAPCSALAFPLASGNSPLSQEYVQGWHGLASSWLVQKWHRESGGADRRLLQRQAQHWGTGRIIWRNNSP